MRTRQRHYRNTQTLDLGWPKNEPISLLSDGFNVRMIQPMYDWIIRSTNQTWDARPKIKWRKNWERLTELMTNSTRSTAERYVTDLTLGREKLPDETDYHETGASRDNVKSTSDIYRPGELFHFDIDFYWSKNLSWMTLVWNVSVIHRRWC